MIRTVLCLSLAACAVAQEIAAVSKAIEEGLAAKAAPGAVCVIGQPGRVLHRKAYGLRSYERPGEAMTLDTVFDAASLTKVVATTTAVMQLGIDTEAPVTRYIPEYPHAGITIRHLLTHYSGLRPDVDLVPEWSGYGEGIRRAIADKPTGRPGERFVYSDINFLLLGEIVRRVSGQPLDEYCLTRVFQPLGMQNSRFNPPAEWRDRIAPTERLKGEAAALRGLVHDPTTRFMGGVAGHAGLFTTADDLARFAAWMLEPSPEKSRFTRPQSPAGKPVRGFGWDIDTAYSSPKGELFGSGGFGHTGFTGTSLWIDPPSRTYVILLTNHIHPVVKPAISGLRRAVANAAARAVGLGGVRAGLDVLEEEGFSALQGRRVALITNHTGLTRTGVRSVDAMLAGGVKVAGLFSPEHGIAGKEDHENVGDSKDEKTGLPIWSLYSGQNRKPSAERLRGVDVLVFDIQDIGTRFYTYLSTLVNAMEEAARLKIPFMVLDRPNPISGTRVEGPMLEPALQSFIGIRPLPLRHGMTLGELARLINAESNVRAELTVIPARGWQRQMWWDETGLTWVDPSPNMKSLNGALLYGGLGMLEFNRNYSVGRGTGTPFERIGADWMAPRELALHLNTRLIPGVRAHPLRDGVQFQVTDRDVVEPSLLGLEIAAALLKLYPGKIDLDKCERLIGDRSVIAALKRGDDPRTIARSWSAAIEAFRLRRAKYLIYD
jgi:uncharacterized protein YbbC (DUF1343 family)